ncbi:extracellular solute-binding protein [Eubacteriales bacterium OttesenSCG-928-A19]|nr:extracellular solute-binding protein [Eubacteriales bacterium OttesenSCG-928-A19]
MTVLLMVLALMMSLFTPAVMAEEPMTITFWHHRGSGAQYECVTHAVEGFNATVGAEKGIVVEEAFIGDYVTLFAQIQLAVQSGEAPNVVSAANTYVAYMLEDDMIVDMAPLADAEGYDITGNIMDWLLEIGGNTDGEVHSLPYCRSTPLFYYNKAIASELGIEIGDMITIDELIAFGEAAMQQNDAGETTRFGFEIFNDFGYYNAAWIYQLGSNYMVEGGGSPSLEDGTMLKVLTDWRDWIDAGWCRPFDVTNAGDTAQTMFVNGELASYMNSSAGLGNLMIAASETGVEVGVAMFPTYDPENHVAEIGGANVSIIGADNSDEEIQASWEFIKYLMSDEEQFFNAKTSGYVACTKSIADYSEMVEFWAEKPEFKVAYDQLLSYGRGQETPFVAAGQDFTQIVWDNCSLLIQEKSITPEEAVANIKAESDDIW